MGMHVWINHAVIFLVTYTSSIVSLSALDPCQSNPCYNDGQCSQIVSQEPGVCSIYQCNCPPCYEGQHCLTCKYTDID